MKKFEVGEEVASVLLGHGVVVKLSSGSRYPVHIRFTCEPVLYNSFTYRGMRIVGHLSPEIYHLEDFKKRFDLPLYDKLPE